MYRRFIRFFYYYCEKVQVEKHLEKVEPKCDLCRLIEFLHDIQDKNLINGLSPKKFLQFNYNNRLKLERFADEILRFF